MKEKNFLVASCFMNKIKISRAFLKDGEENTWEELIMIKIFFLG